MKMYAMFDSVTCQYATCLEHPQFGRSAEWTANAFEARLHKSVTSMKSAMTKMMWRLETNVEMLKDGDWDAPDSHNVQMKKWSIECERRESLDKFGLVIVELDDAAIVPHVIKA